LSVPVKLVLFALVLAAVFAAGLGIGAALGPLDNAPPAHSGHAR
jgi:hypothetical protein